MRSGLCVTCRPCGWFPYTQPSHCFGRGDQPAQPGTFGGFRCSCPCRAKILEPTTIPGRRMMVGRFPKRPGEDTVTLDDEGS
jgi:hypothetical protein